MRFCNLLYGNSILNPNGPPEECNGVGYSINLDRVATILGIRRDLLNVIRRDAGMEINFNPVVLIRSYKEPDVFAYINETNQQARITTHPAFANITITDSQWREYAIYYYQQNINTKCSCAYGYSSTPDGLCVAGSCERWTTIHPSDTFTTNPNGRTCGGFDRSAVGCVETPPTRSCVCREGFAGLACEQVLCAHANGAVCSGNGYCDKEYNTCVCKFNYVGIACEIKLDSSAPCNNNGQQTKSYPLPSYNKAETDYKIPEELDVKVEWL